METSDLKIKGVYETLDELCKAHPAGEDGDAYIVELNAPNNYRCLYKWSRFLNKWVNYGLSEEDKIKENLKREQKKSEMAAKSRLAAEVRQFCKNKYGTPFPGEIECGKIKWLNVPVFAMSAYNNMMKSIPYLLIEDMAEETDRIRKMMDEHDEKYPKLNGEKVNLPPPGLSDEKKEKYFAKYPGLIELVESIEEWRNESIKLLEELSAINDLKPLNSEQLKLLGINFNPYDRGK